MSSKSLSAHEILLVRMVASLVVDAEEPLARVEALCDRWDKLSKGETATTRQIRAAILGSDD